MPITEPVFAADQAPSWGPYKIFPWWHVEDSSGYEESSTAVFESKLDEHRVIGWKEDRQVIKIGGMTMTQEAHREFRAFRRLVKMQILFLMRDTREYEAHKELLGVGDGIKSVFQLRLHNTVQELPVTRNIYFPNHAYPDLLDMYGKPRHRTEHIQVFVDNDRVFEGWGVERLTGKLIFDTPPTGEVRWSGTFYNLMRSNQPSFSTVYRNGYYAVESGIDIIEPKGRS